MGSEEGLSRSATRVQQALDLFGLDFQVTELPASTRTAKEAALAVGCDVSQIAKSLVFRFAQRDRPLLVIVSGSNRVDTDLLSAYLGEKIIIAQADYVRAQTGFAIGGVPPVGHIQTIRTLIDEDMNQYAQIWAAAGTPRAVFRLSFKALVEITNGEIVQVS